MAKQGAGEGGGGVRKGGPQGFLDRIASGEIARAKPHPGEAKGGRDRSSTSAARRPKDEDGRKKTNGNTKKKPKDEYRPAKGADTHPRRPKSRTEPETKGGAKRVAYVQGEIQKNRRGFAFLIAEPQDVFIPPEYAEGLLSGDTIKVWVNTKGREILKVDIVKRGIHQFIGTYLPQGGKHYVQLRDRTMEELVLVKAPDVKEPAFASLHAGNKVLAIIETYEPLPRGRLLQDYGPNLAPKLDTLAVVTRAQWPQEFSPEATEEAARASLEVIQGETGKLGKAGGRKDLRDKAFVTIDGRDSRDFDDAVHVERTKTGFVLYVAIADVGEFVKQGGGLDGEAYGRSTSVYFPDSVLPMLPEALSNEACSLKPKVDRLTLTCEMHYDTSGKKRQVRVYESVISSHRRCVYEDVQKEFEAGDAFWQAPYELFNALKLYRQNRGALDMDLPEAKLILDEAGNTIDITKAERKDAHKVIEEFMIAANESVTELMEREGWPFVFRVHETPKPEALTRFLVFARALGLKPDLGDGSSPKKIARFLDSIEGHPLEQVLTYLILRSLKQAKYMPENVGHFGLASEAYTHFTSPIRRYPDLMVHRILKRYIRHEPYAGPEWDEIHSYLAEATEHCSRYERKAEQLARAVEKVKKARFMLSHTGETLSARITNVSEVGLYIELDKWFVEGLVPNDEIGEDFFEFNPEKLLLYGRRSGRKIRIGDEVEVMVLRCDTEQGFIDFTMRIGENPLNEISQ